MARRWPWTVTQRHAQPLDVWEEYEPTHSTSRTVRATAGTVTGYRATGREVWVLSLGALGSGQLAHVESHGRGGGKRKMEVLAGALRSPRWVLSERKAQVAEQLPLATQGG